MPTRNAPQFLRLSTKPTPTWLAALLAAVGATTGCLSESGSSAPSDSAGASGAAGEDNQAGASGSAGSEAMGGSCNPLGFEVPTPSEVTTCDGELPEQFAWEASGPLLAPISDQRHELVSIKDPTVVFFEGRWHVYATTASQSGAWNMVHVSFTDWAEASLATPYYLDDNPALRGYHCAPQLFYFTPQDKWYLVYQSGPPQYSTADDPGDPASWTAPKSFFAAEPAIVTEHKGTGGWLDFWVICDTERCHLFFTDDNGNFYRSETALADFPEGFGEPLLVLSDTKANLFEAAHVYRLKGEERYLAVIEAFGPTGRRYYRSFLADTLDGEWTPLRDSWADPFAGANNVTYGECGGRWSGDISHGELLRDGFDETLTVDPCRLQWLYQGVDPLNYAADYSQIPWRLGLLSLTSGAPSAD